jgi:lysophospholipase L1-like esterase
MAATGTVGPKHYYLALGDSLARGYQPPPFVGDNHDGYAQQYFRTDLAAKGVAQLVDYGCSGETSHSFIAGGCPFSWSVQNPYLGPQLYAALSFIHNHHGQVSPVTVDIGAGDALALINPSTCAISATWQTALATFDTNFTYSLALLHSTLDGTGDLVAMNYYDPYQNQCSGNPQVLSLLQTVNQHIQRDAALLLVPVADVFDAFGGATTPNPNLSIDTWITSPYHDIHPTTAGYGIITRAVQEAIGY